MLIVNLYLNKQTKKIVDSINELANKPGPSVEELAQKAITYTRKTLGYGNYAVVKQWFDTHDCTTEYVRAYSISDVFVKIGADEDSDNYTIINVFKVG